MYDGVPITRSSSVSRAPSVVRDDVPTIPKSRIFTRSSPPSSASIRFAGFRSRCTKPARCAAARPSAISRTMRAARAGGSGASRASTSSSVGPSISSMTRYGPSGDATPCSITVTTFGCPRLIDTAASRRRRSACAGSPRRDGNSSLIATARPSSSRARSTRHIAPSPSCSSRIHAPSRVPDSASRSSRAADHGCLRGARSAGPAPSTGRAAERGAEGVVIVAAEARRSPRHQEPFLRGGSTGTRSPW